jgi:hypothetical protein
LKIVGITLYRVYGQHALEALFAIQDLKLELLGLGTAKKLLEEFLANGFREKLEEDEAKLQDNSIGAHEQFAVIYRVER